MTFVQLEYFVEVANQQSFTKAADVLYVSQPALSKSIKALEQEFDCQLLNRDGKKMVLTEKGHIFYDHASKILATYNQQCDRMREQMNLAKSSLRLGIPPTAGAMGFFEIVSRYKEDHPLVDIQIEECTSLVILGKIMDDLLDFGVIINRHEDDRLISIPICESEAVLITSANHPLAQKESCSFRELEGLPFLSISKDYMFYEIVMSKFQQAHVQPTVIFSSYFWEGLYEMAANGLGVTILPKPLVQRFHQSRTRELHLTDPTFPYSLWVVYKKGKPLSVPMKEFIAICREARTIE